MAGGNTRRTSQTKRRLEQSSESSCGSRPAKIPRHRREEEEEVDGPGLRDVPQVEPSSGRAVPEAGPSAPPIEVIDLSTETSVLARAMAESLREHEKMQARFKKPMMEKSIEEIIDTFCDSQILLQALCKEWFGLFFSEKGLKVALVKLLVQERQCNKWYPGRGTHQYFKSLTMNLMETGDKLMGSSSEFVAELETCIADKTSALIYGYSVFPQGAPGGVPQMFAELQGSGVEVIDLLDD
ncbi:hypothetical protein BSKO_13196 [Bryopsis sp. KO-2023]|nr:hypothetical protein BSKO_13196 [Bryopsis sp. KO-2023]